MVAVAVVGALVQRVSELVNRRPFPDSVALVSTYAPIHPCITLVHVVFGHRQIGRIKGEVGVVTVRHLTRCIAGQVLNHSSVARSTHHPLGLIGVACRPVEISHVLTGWAWLGGVPERGTIKRIEVIW